MSISDFEGLICPACSNPIDEEFLAKTISCSHCKTNLKDKKYLAFIEYLILHGIIDVNFFDHTLYGEEVGRTTEEEELHDETDPNDYEDTSKRINYDEIVFMFDLWWLSSYKYFFNKNKFFLWGNRISNFKLVNKLRNYIMLRSKGNILYSECPIKKMLEAGIRKDKIFIAHNTIHVKNHGINKNFQNKNLLFVGRLQKRKKIEI